MALVADCMLENLLICFIDVVRPIWSKIFDCELSMMPFVGLVGYLGHIIGCFVVDISPGELIGDIVVDGFRLTTSEFERWTIRYVCLPNCCGQDRSLITSRFFSLLIVSG